MGESAIVLMLRTILYGWIVALWELIKYLCAWFKIRKCGGRRPTKGGCVPIEHPAFVRPDPLNYSQQDLIARRLAVTWDNPDVQLFKAGVPVPSSRLDPSTTYQVRARIWNKSTEAPVVNMPVHLSFLDFGIGAQSHHVGTINADVGVLGARTNRASPVGYGPRRQLLATLCRDLQRRIAQDSAPRRSSWEEELD